MDARQIQSIVFTLADGATVLFPEAKPFVEALEWLIEQAEQEGIIPVELSSEQRAAIAAGMAAARASAVTEFQAHQKKG